MIDYKYIDDPQEDQPTISEKLAVLALPLIFILLAFLPAMRPAVQDLKLIIVSLFV